MSDGASASAHTTLGWRFVVGAALFAGGYIALGLLPLVRSLDTAAGLKTVLTGLVTMMPMLTKVAAVAVMGKPGFELLRAQIFKALHRLRPVQEVSRLRYKMGLVLFVIAIVGGWIVPRVPGLLNNWNVLWSLIGDAILIVGLILLGGNFCDKLHALFDYDAMVSFPVDAGARRSPVEAGLDSKA